jgi:hypothetical protein
MENKVEFKTYKFTDWSRHTFLTPEQRKQLLTEKIERAKMQYLANQKCPARAFR